MDQITLEELLELLAVVPQGTVFQLGPPPGGISNSLSLQVYCTLPAEKAQAMQATARRIYGKYTPLNGQPTPAPAPAKQRKGKKR